MREMIDNSVKVRLLQYRSACDHLLCRQKFDEPGQSVAHVLTATSAGTDERACFVDGSSVLRSFDGSTHSNAEPLKKRPFP